MDLRLTGKVALVTGASHGIGLSIADAFVAEGMHVMGTSRRAPPPREGLVHLPLDMTAAEAGDVAVAVALDRFGRLDVLVNNVGGAWLRPGFVEQSDADWGASMSLNLMSVVRITRAALPHLELNRGVVVNISSVNARLPSPTAAPYSATKAAMNSLTVALSLEYARRGVRVVGVAPGPVRTPLWLGPDGMAAQAAALRNGDPRAVVDETIAAIPLGRFTTPDEVADLVTFLASPRAGAITGTTVTIDGGLTPST